MKEFILSLIISVSMIFNPPEISLCYTIEESLTEDSHTATLTDGNVMFEYDYNTNTKYNIRIYDNSESSVYYYPTTKENSVSYEGLCNYRGTVNDGNNIVYKAISDGFSIQSYYSCSSYYDIVLLKNSSKIRVIVFKDGMIKYFQQNDKKILNYSTYINKR